MNLCQMFILLKNKNNLTESQAGYLKRLREINEPIYKALLLKENSLGSMIASFPKKHKPILRARLKT